ncbi:MAG: hypothetical protein GC206_13350 [Alphaproteobacteria bacterium]|nr:hypothetical protein [Alphaproteobacteria bacterium]
MSAEFSRARRGFYFSAQHGRCYLRSTEGCRQVGGQMKLDAPHDPREATFEHLVPRAATKNGGAPKGNLLLACAACNFAKGSKRGVPLAIHYTIAQHLHLAWANFAQAQSLCEKADAHQPPEKGLQR